jgi:hypothetical protein
MNINININHQSELRSSKKAYVIGSVVMLVLSAGSIIGIILEAKAFLVFHAVYFFCFAIVLYFNSKGKTALDLLGHSYFRMDDNGFACKMDLFSKKVIQVSWIDIQDIVLKLFEVQLMVNGAWISINLEKLSDDYLKMVKNAFEEFQKHLDEKNAEVAVPA